VRFRRLTQALLKRLDEILPGVYGDRKTGHGCAQFVQRMGVTAGGRDQAIVGLPLSGFEIFNHGISPILGFNDRA